MSKIKTKKEVVTGIEAELVRLLRASEGLSRLELSSRLNLAPSTVGIYVNRLVQEGFIYEGEKVGDAQGRPSILLHLNPNGGQFIGVDFESRTILAQVVDFANTPLRQAKRTIHPHDSANKIINKISKAIEDIYPEDPSQVLGIGVGVPGRVDQEGKISLGYRHFKNWKNISLAEELAKQFKVNVLLENNVRSMALAEKWFGQGRGVEHFATVGVRGGVGFGVIVDGKLVRGFQNIGGEMGQWKMKNAGNQTLEELASVNAILEKWKKKKSGSELPSIEDLVAAYREKDRKLEVVLEEASDALGSAMALVVQLLDLERVILSGPLCGLGDSFLEKIKEKVEEGIDEERNKPVIAFSKLGEFSGAMGAAALMVQSWKPKR